MILFLFITEIAKRVIQKKGDFNIYLLQYEISDSINNFIDTLSSNFFLPNTFTYGIF